MKKIIAIILALSLALCAFAACSKRPVTDEMTEELSTADVESEKEKESETKTESDSEHPRVKVEMDGRGEFVIELYPEFAPKTVDNFLKLVDEGFYDGLTFHRVMKGFMAQGGDGSEKGRKAESIKGEFAANGFDKNTLSHTRGVVSMARTAENDSASSQFFICYSDTCSYLDGQYAAFGKVIEGMDVVDAFADGEVVANAYGEKSSPVETIYIKTMEVIR